MTRSARSPALVAGLVLLLYAGWVGWAHHIGHDWRDWANVGSNFLDRSATVPAIDATAERSTSAIGYDGQFFLYIALAPSGAAPYIDNPSYRYGRIAYPLAARAVALGRDSAIPFALIALNLLAVAVGTWALAAWLRRRGLSPWLALLYAAYPGVFYAVWRDLSEVLAYSLAAVAVLVFDGERTRRLAASAALFAAAALTREGVLVFALVWAAALAARGRRLAAVLFGLAAVAPYAAYRFLFLPSWLGNAGVPDALRPTPVPFGGILAFFPWGGVELQRVYAVALPGALCAVLAVIALRRGAREPAVWALLANALAFVVFLPERAYGDYYAAGRISTSVVLAFLLAAPALARVLAPTRAWLWVPVVAWFAPWFVLLPAALDARWA